MMNKTEHKNIYSQFLFFILLISMIMTGTEGLQAQSKYRTKGGVVNFNASTPLQDIEAVNEAVNAIMEAETGRFAVVMLIKDFEFPRKLMQEHFNENYMETETYPKSTFSGVIEDFDLDSVGSNEIKKTVKGELTIHGVKRSRSEEITLRKKGNTIHLESSFIVRPEEHDIEVPKIVFAKIAQEVEVTIDLQLLPDSK